jgi:hypothetical protein
MIDHTFEILKAKYAPDSVRQVEVSQPETVEEQKTVITLEELLLKVRSDMLSSWGLDPKGRHEFADGIVARETIHKCGEFDVIDMPEGGAE